MTHKTTKAGTSPYLVGSGGAPVTPFHSQIALFCFATINNRFNPCLLSSFFDSQKEVMLAALLLHKQDWDILLFAPKSMQ